MKEMDAEYSASTSGTNDANHRASMSLPDSLTLPRATKHEQLARGKRQRQPDVKYSGTAVLACRWGQPGRRGGKYCKRGNRQDAAHRESRRRIEGASEFN